MACAPLKLVHLLHSIQAGPTEVDILQPAEYRVAQGWHQAVRKLAAYAPIIILDLRAMTRPVELEFVHIVRSDLYKKTIFLMTDQQTLPILLRHSVPEGISRFIADPSVLPEATRGLAVEWMKNGGTTLIQLLFMRLQASKSVRLYWPNRTKAT